MDLKMRIWVYWFLRPMDMASLKARCEHAQTREVYSATDDGLICFWQKSTFEIKRSKKNSAHCSDDKSYKEEGKDAEEHFFCNLVVDSYRGLFMKRTL